MRHWKKGNVLLGIFVALAILASLIPLGSDVAQAQQAKPKDTATTLSISSGAATLGGTVVTEIWLNGYSGSGGLGAYNIYVLFDRTKLQATLVQGSGVTDDPYFTAAPTNNRSIANTSTGELRLNTIHSEIPGPGAPGAQPGFTGPNIKLARVTWQLNAAGAQALTLQVITLSDTSGTDLSPTPTLQHGTLTVWAVPVASFTVGYNPSSGLAPNTVTFTDTSSGPGQTFSWNFGDGSGSSSQNPSKVYSTAGNYNVTLSVTNPAGSNTSAPTAVSIYSMPVAGFSKSLNPTTGVAPVTANFTDSSTGNVTGWSWNFGDGTGSSSQNPSKIYSTAGNYTATLTASNPVGSNSSSQAVSIYSTPTASFTKSATSGNTPLTVNFTSTSTGNVVTYLWTFGDGTTSAEANPSKTYSTYGNFNVTLQVTNPAGSNTSSAQTVNVYSAPVAGFTKSATSGNTPLTVNFTDTSTGNITGWLWTFGDGTTSTAQNPSKTYSTAGNFTVTLAATNPAGNNTSSGQTVSAYSVPVAGFTKSATSGNTPLNVNFTDTSTGNVTGWSWNFGDGTSSTAQNPSKTFSTYGNFNVTLTASNPAGSNTSAGQTVNVYSVPVANFSASTTSTNPGASINFTDSSTGNIVTWSWSFGDGTGSSTQNPTKSYAADGSYNVSLTVTNPAGTHSLTKTSYIVIVSYKGETAMSIGIEPSVSNNAYLNARISRFFNPITSETVTLDAIGAFDAYMSYAAGAVNMKSKKNEGGFSSVVVNYDTEGGTKTTINGYNAESAAVAPTDLFKLFPWLTGRHNESVTVTLHFNTITRLSGGEVPQNADVSKTFRRGDANNNGDVTITDALFIAQYLAGLRDLGETTLLVNPVNAATPRNDLTTGANITIQDALYIAQLLAGLRDDYYVM